MVWIEAILAFCVTMMAFSTIVSMVVEMIHRMFRLREANLKAMLDQVYARLIQPQVKQFINESATKSEEFAEEMTNPDFEPGKKQTYWASSKLNQLLNVKNIKKLSPLEFVEKLAKTEEGQALLKKSRLKGEAYLKTVLLDLVSQYEKYEDSAREYFTRRARFFSIVVAICLAIFFNINPFIIFSAYLNDTKLRSNVINQGEIIGEKLTRQQALLEELKKNQSTVSEDPGEEIKKVYTNIQKSIQDLETMHIPFGWGDYFQAKNNAAANQTKNIGVVGWIKWFFSVLLGGLLIGLGGPFWFDLFKRLSAFVGLARNPKIGKEDQTGQKEDAPEATDATPKIDPVALFKRAAAAKVSAKEPDLLPRPLFDVNGHKLGGK